MKNLILKLSNNMNNLRLSSSKDEKDIITTSEIETLLFADPISVPLNDGRLLDLMTYKLESGLTGGSVFEIINNNSGEVTLANSLEECASIIGVTRNLLSRAFSSSADSSFISEISIDKYTINRIGVFLKLPR
jgi:hypothetical protein